MFGTVSVENLSTPALFGNGPHAYLSLRKGCKGFKDGRVSWMNHLPVLRREWRDDPCKPSLVVSWEGVGSRRCPVDQLPWRNIDFHRFSWVL